MSFGTILQQGSFIVPETVVNRVIAIPASADWMMVRNYTQMGTVTTGADPLNGYEYFWQRGMPQGSAMAAYKGVGNFRQDDVILSGGFTLYDPSGQDANALPLIGNAVATTNISGATSPIVLTATTTGLVDNTGSVRGSVVRLSGNPGQQNTSGIDFAIGAVTDGVSFSLTVAGLNALATSPGAGGAMTGAYRVINTDPLFYPRNRYITKIVKATGTISTSVQHGLTPGQVVRFIIPAEASMVQLDARTATVTSVTDDFNFVIDLDISAFTTFTFPTHAQVPTNYPQMVPVGENTAISLVSAASQIPSIGGAQIHGTQTGILADATVNTGFLGMVLGTGAAGVLLTGTAITGPAGTDELDKVYWVAGKSELGGL